MCFFFETGVERQLNSRTETEANKNMEISCSICCSRGYNVKCDQCPIASAHEQQKSAILDARKAERQRKLQRLEEKRKLEKLIDSAKSIYINVRIPSDIEKKSADLERLADLFITLKGI